MRGAAGDALDLWSLSDGALDALRAQVVGQLDAGLPSAAARQLTSMWRPSAVNVAVHFATLLKCEYIWLRVTAALISGGTGALALWATLAVLLAFRARGIRGGLLATVVVTCLAGGAVASSTPAARSAVDTQSASPADGQLVARINAFRASVGLPQFQPSPALTALALEHAQDMLTKGYFGHDEPGGQAGLDRLNAFYDREGYETVYGEDVGLVLGPPDAASFLAQWTVDPVHRDILVGPKGDPLYSNIGVAVLSADSAPGVYSPLGSVSVAVVEIGPPQPVLGQSVVAAPVGRGVVLVRKPGTKSFTLLTAGAIFDTGTEIDATKGRITLTSAADDAGNLQAADFYSGRFIVSYAPDTAPRTPGPRPRLFSRTCGSLLTAAERTGRRCYVLPLPVRPDRRTDGRGTAGRGDRPQGPAAGGHVGRGEVSARGRPATSGRGPGADYVGAGVGANGHITRHLSRPPRAKPPG